MYVVIIFDSGKKYTLDWSHSIFFLIAGDADDELEDEDIRQVIMKPEHCHLIVWQVANQPCV